jgi:hypothetical protein
MYFVVTCSTDNRERDCLEIFKGGLQLYPSIGRYSLKDVPICAIPIVLYLKTTKRSLIQKMGVNGQMGSRCKFVSGEGLCDKNCFFSGSKRRDLNQTSR